MVGDCLNPGIHVCVVGVLQLRPGHLVLCFSGALPFGLTAIKFYHGLFQWEKQIGDTSLLFYTAVLGVMLWDSSELVMLTQGRPDITDCVGEHFGQMFKVC